LIEQGGDLLAEIRGVREARQLKTLQRVPRSGKKELPGWLGSGWSLGLRQAMVRILFLQ